MPTPICFKLLRHAMRLALSLALASAGNNMAARMAMMARTTSNSINVKPPRLAPPARLETLPPVRLGSRSGVSSAAVVANVFFIVFKLVTVRQLAHVRLRQERRVSFQTPSYSGQVIRDTAIGRRHSSSTDEYRSIQK